MCGVLQPHPIIQLRAAKCRQVETEWKLAWLWFFSWLPYSLNSTSNKRISGPNMYFISILISKSAYTCTTQLITYENFQSYGETQHPPKWFVIVKTKEFQDQLLLLDEVARKPDLAHPTAGRPSTIADWHGSFSGMNNLKVRHSLHDSWCPWWGLFIFGRAGTTDLKEFIEIVGCQQSRCYNSSLALGMADEAQGPTGARIISW